MNKPHQNAVKPNKETKYRERYSRQLMLPNIGETGQQRLRHANVLVIGAGGLGCPVLQYLVAAGVGHIHLYDNDVVELSNLQRQTLYKINHLQRYKAEVAAQQLYGLNPDCQVHWHRKPFSEHTAKQARFAKFDAVLDCSDNFPTRFLLNKLCFEQRIPLIGAGAEGTNGQLWVLDFRTPQTSDKLLADNQGCLRCLFPANTPLPSTNCNNLGVLGATLGALGSMQAGLCISLLLGQTQARRFIQLDGFGATTRQFALTKSARCNVCG